MTLVLSLVSRAFALQVSDRMLSANARPLYPASNKTVVVLARDGMYAMSYTGLARLGQVDTDDWMARRVAGVQDWGPPPIAWLMRRRLPQWLDIGTGVRTMTESLNRAFAHDVSPGLRNFPHGLTIAGWQWKFRGSRARPIMWSIERGANGVFGATQQFPRHHYGSGFFFSAMPSPATVSQIELRGVVDQLSAGAAHDVESARRLLVETIRLAATRRPRVVGPHCMSVSLYPPRGEIAFIPHPTLVETRALPAPLNNPRLGTTFFVHAAPQRDRREAAPSDSTYTPWLVVGDDMVVSHSLVQATTAPLTYSRGAFEFSVGGGSI